MFPIPVQLYLKQTIQTESTNSIFGLKNLCSLKTLKNFGYHGSNELYGRLLSAKSWPQQADRSIHRNLWKSAFYYQTGRNQKYSTWNPRGSNHGIVLQSGFRKRDLPAKVKICWTNNMAIIFTLLLPHCTVSPIFWFI